CRTELTTLGKHCACGSHAHPLFHHVLVLCVAHFAAFVMQDAAVGLCRPRAAPAIDWFAECLAQATLRSTTAAKGLGVTAPAVVFRVLDQSRTHGIEIDVSSHRTQCLPLALDQHALEAIHPQRALAPASFVKPAAKALLHLFNEQRKIAETLFE